MMLRPADKLLYRMSKWGIGWNTTCATVWSAITVRVYRATHDIVQPAVRAAVTEELSNDT